MVRPLPVFATLTLVATAALGTAQSTPPAVARFEPAHGSSDVDPRTTQLRVVFAQPMDTAVGWSVCGGGATFPEIVAIRWHDARTLEIDARLQAETRYVMPLNCTGSSQRFRSRDGRRLPPTPWSFTTAPADDHPADAAQRARNAAALEAVVTAIDRDYSYRDRVVADWPALFDAARERLLSAPNDHAFTDRLARALGAAQDPHLWLRDDRGLRPTHAAPGTRNIAPNLLPKLVPAFERRNEAIWQGRFPGTAHDPDDDVGYLAILTLGNRQAAAVRTAHDALDELRDCRALILDLRLNGGGNELLALQLASWFADRRAVYARQVTRDPETGAWTRRSERRLLPPNRPPKRFDGPVYALIGPGVTSSAEAFALMLRQCPQVTMVGQPTRGSSGNPQPHPLPNGATLFVPSWRALDAAGELIEGRGVLPDILVETRPEDVREGDPVLARALDLAEDPRSPR